MPVVPFPTPIRRPDPPQSAAPDIPAYAELQVTTNFSFLRGASHPHELVLAAKALGYTAIGVTDRNSITGVVRAHLAARDENLRLLVGARLDFRDGSPSVLCYPTDRAAFGRLTRLLTDGKRKVPDGKGRTKKGDCELDYADLLRYGEGQLVVAVPPPRLDATFRAALDRLARDFPDRAWLAASHLYRGDDARRLHRLAALADQSRLPLVATNDVLYHQPERRQLQDVLTCIRERCTIDGAGLRLEPNAERHLKAPAEIARLFKNYPDAIAETQAIATRCAFDLDQLKYEYPDEIAPDGEDPQARLERLTEAGLARRYPKGIPAKVRSQVGEEFTLIATRRYAPFFLTVEDIVRYAEREGILCQGRGSAANSAVCYALGITNVDPQEGNSLFARFLSTARDEPPDIDVDFEHERREEVIQYIYRKYGRHRAGMTATVTSYRSRGAIREVGKALGLSDDVTGALASSIWGWSQDRLNRDRARTYGFDADDPRLGLALELSAQLIGFPRHLSQHPGGFVITQGRLDESATIENAAMPERTMICWDKDDIDALNMVKVDVLALGMLTCLHKALDLLAGKTGETFDLGRIGKSDAGLYDDEKVWEMLGRADSIGVFQIESRAQQSMLPRLKPRKFYDLVIEVAIVRPGPIQGDMVHPYLKRREGSEKPDYPSEELKEVLAKTLGVPLFQEQCMRIAMVAADFSAAEADGLRRAMATFKKAGDIEQFEDMFIGRMVKKGYKLDFATRCFSQIKGFGTYGFPESHAASFAFLVYASAWIKCHHPDVFCAAILNSQPMGFYAPAQLVRDAREHGVEIRPVDVNHSRWDHALEPTGDPARHAVRLGFRIVAGLSRAEIETGLIGHRETGYASIADLVRRAGLRRSTLRRLAQADALGSLHLDRRQGLWALGGVDEEALPLFAHAPLRAGEDAAPIVVPAALPALPAPQAVAEDYAATGLSLKRHPLAFLRASLAAQGYARAADLRTLPDGRRLRIAGLVLFRQRPGTAKGTIFMTIEDETGAANLIVWPKISERFRRAVYGAKLLACTGRLQREGQVIHLVAEGLEDRTAVLRRLHRGTPRFRLPAGLGDEAVHAGDDMRLRSRDFR